VAPKLLPVIVTCVTPATPVVGLTPVITGDWANRPSTNSTMRRRGEKKSTRRIGNLRLLGNLNGFVMAGRLSRENATLGALTLLAYYERLNIPA
jgi:hypothetical protein